MSTPARETSIGELKHLTTLDEKASKELAKRISELELDLEEGRSPEHDVFEIVERSNKGIVKDLNDRMEAISESPGDRTATDNEMLRALNDRLSVCDIQTMQLARLRDLQLTVRSSKQKPFGVGEEQKHANMATEPEKTVSPEHEVREEASASKHGDHIGQASDSASEYSDSVYSQDEEDEPEVDKSAWALLYQIMDVDPKTSNADIEAVLNRYALYCRNILISLLTFDRNRTRLALKHSPQYLPNDSTALARWEKVTKAFDILVNPEKRIYYDSHGNTPSGLEDVDAVTLEQAPKGA